MAVHVPSGHASGIKARGFPQNGPGDCDGCYNPGFAARLVPLYAPHNMSRTS